MTATGKGKGKRTPPPPQNKNNNKNLSPLYVHHAPDLTDSWTILYQVSTIVSLPLHQPVSSCYFQKSTIEITLKAI